MYRICFVLLTTLSLLACSNKLTKTLKSTDSEYKLKVAENYYAQKSYDKAQILFEDLFPVFKGTAKFEDLYYKYAYTSYYLKDYSSAENLFKSFVETFPTSTRAEEADFMRAFSYYKQSPKVELDQTNTTKAIGQLQAFINNHPLSARVPEATAIIDESRRKLEVKDYNSAFLYFNLGFFKAAAISFKTLLENYPDSDKSDEYQLMVIKSYYLYASNSIDEKQTERFDKVVNECIEFADRFPESKLGKSVESYKAQSLNHTNIKNEQSKKAT